MIKVIHTNLENSLTEESLFNSRFEFDGNAEVLDVLEPNYEANPDCYLAQNPGRASGYSHEILDITLQSLFEEKETEGLTYQQIGASVVAKIYAMNDLANGGQGLSDEDFDTMMLAPQNALIERYLFAGALPKARAKILALDNTYFSEEQKAMIAGFLAAYP